MLPIDHAHQVNKSRIAAPFTVLRAVFNYLVHFVKIIFPQYHRPSCWMMAPVDVSCMGSAQQTGRYCIEEGQKGVKQNTRHATTPMPLGQPGNFGNSLSNYLSCLALLPVIRILRHGAGYDVRREWALSTACRDSAVEHGELSGSCMAIDKWVAMPCVQPPSGRAGIQLPVSLSCSMLRQQLSGCSNSLGDHLAALTACATHRNMTLFQGCFNGSCAACSPLRTVRQLRRKLVHEDPICMGVLLDRSETPAAITTHPFVDMQR